MEKKRKEDEKRKKLDQQSKSLVAVKDELEQLHTKDRFLNGSTSYKVGYVFPMVIWLQRGTGRFIETTNIVKTESPLNWLFENDV